MAELRWQLETKLSKLNHKQATFGINGMLGCDSGEPMTIDCAVALSKEAQEMQKLKASVYREEIYELVDMWNEYAFWARILALGEAPQKPAVDS